MDHSKLRSPLETEEVENNWAISYGDMITLLLGFFVIFFNIKSDTMNLKLLKKDLDQYFESNKSAEPARTPAQVDVKNKYENTPMITTDISNRLQIKSNIEGERILVEFPGVSFFKSASHALSPEGQAALSDFALAIDQHLGSFRLVVRGYTDALPLNSRSFYKDNLELSAFRSISAIRFLAKQGVRLENMRIAGYGESSGDRQNRDQKILSDQRKVVIVIEPLDHTEKVSSVKSKGPQPDAIGIEESLAAEVPGRELAAADHENPVVALAKEFYQKIPNKEEVVYDIRLQAYAIENKIEENSAYKKLISYLVKRELKSRGYSDSEISQMTNDQKEKGRVNK